MNQGIIAFLIFTILSFLINLYAVVFIIKLCADYTMTTYIVLLFFLHISNVGDCITSLPYTFNFSDNWCLFNQSMKFYFGLMNIVAVGLLIQGSRVLLLLNSSHSWKSINTQTKLLVSSILLIFPCIAFLPFFNGVYHNYSNNPWCIVPYEGEQLWILGVQYGWAVLMVTVSALTTLYILYYLVMKQSVNKELFRTFMRTVSIYFIIAALSWVPRICGIFLSYSSGNQNANKSTHQFIHEELYQLVLMNISGMLYGLVFVFNRQIIVDRTSERSGSMSSDRLTFSVKDIESIIDDESVRGGSHGLSVLPLSNSCFSGRDSSENEEVRKQDSYLEEREQARKLQFSSSSKENPAEYQSATNPLANYGKTDLSEC